MKQKITNLKEAGQNTLKKTASKLVNSFVDLLLSIDDEDSLAAVTSEILEGQCQDAVKLEGRVTLKNGDNVAEST